MKQVTSLILISVSALSLSSLISCSNNPDDPRLATGQINDVSSNSANAYYNLANSYEKSGKTKKAIKSYRETADRFPLSDKAPEARFRQATLLYNTGQLKDSFDVYQSFIENYNSSKLYSEALKQQYKVADASAQGILKHEFLGLKTRHATATSEKMLKQYIKNAPYSVSAPKAQFSVGELFEKEKLYTKAIREYRTLVSSYSDSSLAPEAMYRIGILLMKEADRGNRNKAALDKAKNAFLDLKQQHPNHPKAKAANAQIAKLASSNVQRSFDNAEFYQSKGQNQAAIIYYKDVISASPSGRLHDLAKQRLAELGQ